MDETREERWTHYRTIDQLNRKLDANEAKLNQAILDASRESRPTSIGPANDMRETPFPVDR